MHPTEVGIHEVEWHGCGVVLPGIYGFELKVRVNTPAAFIYSCCAIKRVW
jgi:hypothetical protein